MMGGLGGLTGLERLRPLLSHPFAKMRERMGHPFFVATVANCRSFDFARCASLWMTMHRGALPQSYSPAAKVRFSRSRVYFTRCRVRLQRVWSKKWMTIWKIKLTRSPMEVLSIWFSGVINDQ